MRSQKLKNTKKLSRNELKNVVGGNGRGPVRPELCELACGFNEDLSVFGCAENQRCETYLCKTNIYATRCVL
ncbi:hypothetical protein DBR43_08165 [Pedobacter sp. KBW06]|uniref:bacteriocin-like protein n=1 Tax=Pedobacter sp. KBW06 TaxID=2153359 RepID=UPI000F59DB9B|nr:hypothetical protein [Pedobacter sp. KBW06]RQO75322.1 hypothetical protein DBR43_08165 [Pedobacter sp. KBW06]